MSHTFTYEDEPNQHMLTRYRDFVDYLFQSKREGADGFLHPAVGMAGEAAEVLDHMKKFWVYDRPYDRAKVMEEMGDTFHYFVMMMIKLDVTLVEVIQNNVEKLQKRYPNGFTKADAIARADKVVEPSDLSGLPAGHQDPLDLLG